MSGSDRWGAARVRWGIGRMSYSVVPGLYAVGYPESSSPVLVTANYKLSFDRLRAAVPHLDAWILVLDTAGVNVWCAAGKGSFGTEELIRRIRACRLDQVVNHRRLVLPQLGAPGVAGHDVKKSSGFKVDWGPIRAEDLAAYLEAGRSASAEMRRKRFPLGERLELVPVELMVVAKLLLAVLPAVFLLGGLRAGLGFWDAASVHGLRGVLMVLAGVFAGAVLTPLLLPWVPGRAFALKGALLGVPVCAATLVAAGFDLNISAGRMEAAAWMLVGTAVAAFLAMNFTGASTFTSLSGVRREMRVAVPLQIAALVLGVLLWAGSLWVV